MIRKQTIVLSILLVFVVTFKIVFFSSSMVANATQSETTKPTTSVTTKPTTSVTAKAATSVTAKATKSVSLSTKTGIDQQAILKNEPSLPPKALNAAVKGYQKAKLKGEVKNDKVLTVIDFDLPSYKKRMWVIDLKSDKTLMNVHTTHGNGSGMTNARSFSNRPGSNKTSLGTYATMNAYYGKHGLSLRVNGLDKGVNNNAYRRAVVVHPAWYATPSFVKKYHRMGRSEGCFAVNPANSKKLINLTKNGSIIYAYSKKGHVV